MQTIIHVPSYTLIRQAVANYEPWIRSRLGCALADTVILRTSFNFAQLGLACWLTQNLLSRAAVFCAQFETTWSW